MKIMLVESTCGAPLLALSQQGVVRSTLLNLGADLLFACSQLLLYFFRLTCSWMLCELLISSLCLFCCFLFEKRMNCISQFSNKKWTLEFFHFIVSCFFEFSRFSSSFINLFCWLLTIMIHLNENMFVLD